MKSILEQIQRLIGTRKEVRLSRQYLGNSEAHGFILAASRQWVLLHWMGETDLDGYLLVRVADITEVRSGKLERFWEQMLRREGVLDRVGIENSIDLRTTRTALESLRKIGKYIIVECESDDDIKSDEFYIGQIIKTDRKDLQFAHFDGLGKWEKDAATIPLEAITNIQFDGAYIRLYSKNIPEFRPNLND